MTSAGLLGRSGRTVRSIRGAHRFRAADRPNHQFEVLLDPKCGHPIVSYTYALGGEAPPTGRGMQERTTTLFFDATVPTCWPGCRAHSRSSMRAVRPDIRAIPTKRQNGLRTRIPSSRKPSCMSSERMTLHCARRAEAAIMAS